MRKQRLSPEQAFAAMFVFLDRYDARAGGDLGALLGDLQINPADGLPFDPAAKADWLSAIDGVVADQPPSDTLATLHR